MNLCSRQEAFPDLRRARGSSGAQRRAYPSTSAASARRQHDPASVERLVASEPAGHGAAVTRTGAVPQVAVEGEQEKNEHRRKPPTPEVASFTRCHALWVRHGENVAGPGGGQKGAV